MGAHMVLCMGVDAHKAKLQIKVMDSLARLCNGTLINRFFQLRQALGHYQ